MRRALGLVVVLAGCAVADPASRTGGVALELSIEGAGHLAVHYEVAPDGTLGFGGGADARARRITWTGAMTDEEIATLGALLETHGWFAANPVSTDRPPEHRTRFRLRWPGGSRRATVHGKSPDVGPIEAHLAAIARRRLEPYLEALPKPETRPDDPPGGV